MVQAFDKLSPSCSARDRWVSCRVQDQLGLLERVPVTNVPQELKEAHVARQIELTDAPKHLQVRLEQGEQTLRPILVHVTTCVLFLGVLDELVHVALQRPIAAGGVGIEPTARLHCQVGCLLYGLHRAIFGRMDHDGTLTADLRDDRRPVFVIMAPAGLALLAATTRSATQRLLPALPRLSLVASGMVEVIRFNRAFQLAVHLIGQGRIAQPPAPAVAGPDMDAQLSGDATRRTRETGGERWPESSAAATASSGPAACS
jgi:hypothetical protein